MYDFGSELAQTYANRCECGQLIEVSTQGGGNCAEYQTEVYVKCQCGQSVLFVLPVN